jgi:two-component system sensor histidine kinase MtrB
MDADARWAADSVVSQVARLRDLVEELLEISRMDSGQAAVSRYDIDLPWLLRTLLASRRWDDRVSLDLQVDQVRTDPRRLERIVANLVDNALAHGSGPVEIAARREDQQLMLNVRDRGPGIDPKDGPHVFERFFKSDPARGGGSGLGLAIARENARLLGGDLTVARSDPSGTVMTVVLPLGVGGVPQQRPADEPRAEDASSREGRQLKEGVL